MASVTSLHKVLGTDRSPRSKFLDGTLLQVASTITFGQPFEVWKTRMGRHRWEGTMESFQQIRSSGGLSAFYRGLGPKLVESLTKGGCLLVVQDGILSSLTSFGMERTSASFLAGAGGGIAQTLVMGPCTFLVTAMVLGSKAGGMSSGAKPTVSSIAHQTWSTKGMAGFYPGGSAIAARQASNWASRVGFTEGARGLVANLAHGKGHQRLSVREEAVAGIIGGVLSCWNHPFEVARIEMQARAINGEASKTMMQVLRAVHAESGLRGLFQGLVPRMGLNINLTLFMVSGSKIVKSLRESSEREGARIVRHAQLSNQARKQVDLRL